MIDVLYDHQVFATQRFGGVSRYFVELARAFAASADVQARMFAPAYVNEYIASGDALHPLSFQLKSLRRGGRYRPPLLSPLLWMAMRARRPDILHETMHTSVKPSRPRGTRMVTTVHDMTVERFPELFDEPERRVADKVSAMRRADAIICISEATRVDLVELHPDLAGRCTVIHHGVDRGVEPAPKPPSWPARYLLYVGTRDHYKNFQALVQALGGASRLPPDLSLLCFGGGPLSAQERDAAVRAGWAPERIVQTVGDDALLAAAYRHAELFVFPSWYEGFGMPLTEAMIHGCPIACSRASSFPEVCLSAAAYFDPMDVDSMTAAIESVVLDPVRRQSLAEAAVRRGADFSWSECARKTAQVYREVLAS
jgi:glycosyltransferase involved in cell wall biosynthesis